jgi:hypothetical protein
MGFVHVAHGKIIEELGVEYDPRGAQNRGGRGQLRARFNSRPGVCASPHGRLD